MVVETVTVVAVKPMQEQAELNRTVPEHGDAYAGTAAWAPRLLTLGCSSTVVVIGMIMVEISVWVASSVEVVEVAVVIVSYTVLLNWMSAWNDASKHEIGKGHVRSNGSHTDSRRICHKGGTVCLGHSWTRCFEQRVCHGQGT